MFDEIFKRWVTTNQLNENDIVPIFLEWNSVFHTKQVYPQDIIMLLQHPIFQMIPLGNLLQYMLKTLGIKKGYVWEEVISPEGKLLNRILL